MVEVVADVHVAVAVHRHPIRVVQLGVGGGRTVTGEPGGAVAGDGVDEPGAGIDPAHPMVVGVGDEHVAAAVHPHPIRFVQLGAGGGGTVTRERADTGTGDGADQPGDPIDPTDPMVEGVGDEHVAAVHPHPGRVVQLGAGGGRTVTGEPTDTGTGDGADQPGDPIDPTDPIVDGVGDEHVAGAVHRHPIRVVQLGAGSSRTITGEPGGGGTGNRADQPGDRIDPAHPLVAVVGDVDVADA